jgi:hypothetical protein
MRAVVSTVMNRGSFVKGSVGDLRSIREVLDSEERISSVEFVSVVLLTKKLNSVA